MKVVIIVVMAGLGFVCGVAVFQGVVFFILPSHSAPSPSKEELTKMAIKAAQEKCDEYAKLACSNPIPSGISPPEDLDPITGRKLAAEGMYPHMARLYWKRHKAIQVNRGEVDDYHSCGATLISEYFVMTSAFCALQMHDRVEKDIIVTIGSVKIDNKALAENYTVEGIAIHDGFHNGTTTVPVKDLLTPYDIALLKLNRPVNFTWSKRPICLNTNYESIDAKNFTFTGFGALLGQSSRLKLQVLDQYANEQIQSDCSTGLKRNNYSVNPDMIICARHPDDNRTLCQHDVGGALQIPLKKNDTCANTYEQVGIATLAFKHDCFRNSTNLPPFAFYTKVDKFIYWIVSYVWPEKLK